MFRNLVYLLLFVSSINCCNLEQFFAEKQVSVEESASASHVVFRGFTNAAVPTPPNYQLGAFKANFELINTYKGAEALDVWVTSNYRYLLLSNNYLHIIIDNYLKFTLIY